MLINIDFVIIRYNYMLLYITKNINKCIVI